MTAHANVLSLGVVFFAQSSFGKQPPKQPLLNHKEQGRSHKGERPVSTCLTEVVPTHSERIPYRPWDSPILSSFHQAWEEYLRVRDRFPCLCLNNTRQSPVCQEKISIFSKKVFLPVTAGRVPARCCRGRSAGCARYRAALRCQTAPLRRRSAPGPHRPFAAGSRRPGGSPGSSAG